MHRILVAMTSLVALSATASAQQPAPAAAGPQATGGEAKAGDTKPGDTKADEGFATQETYRMKEGGMYQPPTQRPASPAQDTSRYGRT